MKDETTYQAQGLLLSIWDFGGLKLNSLVERTLRELRIMKGVQMRMETILPAILIHPNSHCSFELQYKLFTY